jgi:protein-S-isoprenylcysteine O-methyltransferase Ste14
MRPGFAIVVLWVGMALSWIAAAMWQSATLKRAGGRAELRYRIVLIVGGLLFAVPARRSSAPFRLWHVTWIQAWICVAVILLGFAFTWWGRARLGPLWSGTITTKADHRVIDTGPYRIVRHPIYTGILLAVFATAAAKGTVLGLVGALLITTGLWMKARLEERWLSEQLGPDAYESYRRRVPMLLPFGPKSG